MKMFFYLPYWLYPISTMIVVEVGCLCLWFGVQWIEWGKKTRTKMARVRVYCRRQRKAKAKRSYLNYGGCTLFLLTVLLSCLPIRTTTTTLLHVVASIFFSCASSVQYKYLAPSTIWIGNRQKERLETTCSTKISRAPSLFENNGINEAILEQNSPAGAKKNKSSSMWVYSYT